MQLNQEQITAAKEAGFTVMNKNGLIIGTPNGANLSELLAKFAELLAKQNAATADYIAYLYRDSNGTLKLAQETPPPDNAFPVFTTNIQFLDVARLVLDDNVDLIIEHGGVKLWEKLVANINATYRSASLPTVEPVAWGYANTAITGKPLKLMMVKLDNSGDQYPELAIPLYLHPTLPAEQDAGTPQSLLREVNARPSKCYCPPNECHAPVIMGRQTPCIRQAIANRKDGE
jgi:hypothetical protein